ncbi:MAG: hypothetical protein IJ772_05560 [Bacilli bacterium]|nr:hypothetical protein [Bacilli bacterium]
MIDLNTHILTNAYDNEEVEFMIKNKEDFVFRVNFLLSSLTNQNTDIPDFDYMTEELEKKSLALEIPEKFTDFSLKIIRDYSSSVYLSELIKDLSSISIKNFEDNNDELNKLIEEIQLNLANLSKPSDESEPKAFKDLIGSFEEVELIISGELYQGIVSWIGTFPSELIDKMILAFGEKESADFEEKKSTILNSLYSIYKSIIYNLTQTRLFWVKFGEMIDIDNETSKIDPYEVSNDDSFIFDDILDIDDEDDIEFDPDKLEDDENKLGLEGAFAGGGSPFAKIKKGADVVLSTLKKLPGKISKTNKQFKLFRLKHKNHGFYMKYIGRIDGLYERYADEAKLKENGMKDDPVKILKDDAKDYIVDVSDKFTDLQVELIDMSKRISSMSNPKEIMSYIFKYCGMYRDEIKKPKNIANAMIRATRFKVANILFTHNKVYGYNTESVVENGRIPPANHTMVCLFVDRPDEMPVEQSVSDIFKDVSSFKLIAKNEKEPIFETTQVCNNLLEKGIVSNDIKALKTFKKENYRKVKSNLGDFVKNEEKPSRAKKEYQNQIKALWKGIQKSVEYTVKMKSYITDLVNGYFIMMIRIDNLCKECVTSMLQVERLKKDDRYNTGFKGDKDTSNKKYQQKDDGEYKTKAQRAQEKKEQRQSEYTERREQLRERLEGIRRAMRS